ncbi:AAA family ATPase [Candidatus Woesearchaeota archaeon]|nr:AAA family ATPase [Candidatus Woesearchaeota archaeon]
MLILGLTGTFSSGKGEIGEYLISKGFTYYSCSDEIRKELEKREIEETLQNLINVGDELRRKFGRGILGKKVYEQILKDNKKLVVVDSLRNMEEVNELKKNKNFKLIFIDAPIEERYKRIKERKRSSDFVSFNEFKKKEEDQIKGAGTLLKMEDCFKSADFKIYNNSSLEELHRKVDEILEKLS